MGIWTKETPIFTSLTSTHQRPTVIVTPRGKMDAPGVTVLQAVIVPDISTKNLIMRKIRAEWKEELTVLQTRRSTTPLQPHHLTGEVVRMAAVTTRSGPTTGTTNKRFRSQLCGLVGIGPSMSAPPVNSIITTPAQVCHSGRNPTTGTTQKFPEVTTEIEPTMTEILWQETSTVVIGEVLGEGTGQPNGRAIWSSIQAYTMRSQTNIISFKSSKTVSGRPRLKAVPPPLAGNQRTATSRSRAQLLITVVVTIRTESGAIVITGLHTVDMELR